MNFSCDLNNSDAGNHLMALSDDSKQINGIIQIGKAGLKRNDTLHLKSEFNYVRGNGKKFVGRYMIMVAAPGINDEVRFGIICGRKYSKKAVIRNRARRLLKESFRLIKNKVSATHCVFITRQRIKRVKLRVVQKEMIQLMQKAKLI